MNNMKRITDWIVRCYRGDKIVQIIVIKDRTEYEAMKEAESMPDVLNSDDWSMSEKGVEVG